ncbi:MAG TPA: hypothetical protein VJO34_00245, partial [Methylomirabilota bacterium]|nr:hypothetical protein [Methylomirabilota bacterium]
MELDDDRQGVFSFSPEVAASFGARREAHISQGVEDPVILDPAAQSIKLNLFQQVMALWEEAGPYNAACLFQLRGQANFAALQDAIRESCQQAGLGKLALNPKGQSCRYDPAETIRLDQIESGNRARETLCEILTEQMNMPFPHQPHHPIRWAVLNDPHTDSHFLVTVWRHIAADAVSIRLLVRRVLARYYGATHAFSEAPLRAHPPD